MIHDSVILAITLGGHVDLCITAADKLVVENRRNQGIYPDRINLGECTIKRIEELQQYLERLKIHAK